MTVVEAKVEAFRKVAQQKIWPAYKGSTARCGTRSKASRPEPEAGTASGFGP